MNGSGMMKSLTNISNSNFKMPYVHTYNGNPVFRCVISRPFNKPDYGVGYLEYDDNVLIIQGEIDSSLFSPVPDKDRVIPVIKNRTPWNDDCRPEVYIFFSTEQALKWHAW